MSDFAVEVKDVVKSYPLGFLGLRRKPVLSEEQLARGLEHTVRAPEEGDAADDRHKDREGMDPRATADQKAAHSA